MPPATIRSATIRRGFTLIEALVSTTITVLAGSALLYGVCSSIGTTKRSLERAIAHGLAQQMMDEIAGMKYCDDYTQPYQYPLGPTSTESVGTGRTLFNDIDDYVNIRDQPPVDRWNVLVGNDDGIGGSRYQNFQIASYRFPRSADC